VCVWEKRQLGKKGSRFNRVGKQTRNWGEGQNRALAPGGIERKVKIPWYKGGPGPKKTEGGNRREKKGRKGKKDRMRE